MSHHTTEQLSSACRALVGECETLFKKATSSDTTEGINSIIEGMKDRYSTEEEGVVFQPYVTGRSIETGNRGTKSSSHYTKIYAFINRLEYLRVCVLLCVSDMLHGVIFDYNTLFDSISSCHHDLERQIKEGSMPLYTHDRLLSMLRESLFTRGDTKANGMSTTERNTTEDETLPVEGPPLERVLTLEQAIGMGRLIFSKTDQAVRALFGAIKNILIIKGEKGGNSACVRSVLDRLILYHREKIISDDAIIHLLQSSMSGSDNREEGYNYALPHVLYIQQMIQRVHTSNETEPLPHLIEGTMQFLRTLKLGGCILYSKLHNDRKDHVTIPFVLESVPNKENNHAVNFSASQIMLERSVNGAIMFCVQSPRSFLPKLVHIMEELEKLLKPGDTQLDQKEQSAHVESLLDTATESLVTLFERDNVNTPGVIFILRLMWIVFESVKERQTQSHHTLRSGTLRKIDPLANMSHEEVIACIDMAMIKRYNHPNNQKQAVRGRILFSMMNLSDPERTLRLLKEKLIRTLLSNEPERVIKFVVEAVSSGRVRSASAIRIVIGCIYEAIYLEMKDKGNNVPSKTLSDHFNNVIKKVGKDGRLAKFPKPVSSSWLSPFSFSTGSASSDSVPIRCLRLKCTDGEDTFITEGLPGADNEKSLTATITLTHRHLHLTDGMILKKLAEHIESIESRSDITSDKNPVLMLSLEILGMLYMPFGWYSKYSDPLETLSHFLCAPYNMVANWLKGSGRNPVIETGLDYTALNNERFDEFVKLHNDERYVLETNLGQKSSDENIDETIKKYSLSEFKASLDDPRMSMYHLHRMISKTRLYNESRYLYDTDYHYGIFKREFPLYILEASVITFGGSDIYVQLRELARSCLNYFIVHSYRSQTQTPIMRFDRVRRDNIKPRARNTSMTPSTLSGMTESAKQLVDQAILVTFSSGKACDHIDDYSKFIVENEYETMLADDKYISPILSMSMAMSDSTLESLFSDLKKQ